MSSKINKSLLIVSLVAGVFALAVSDALLTPCARAGGPLLLSSDGTPIRWPRVLTRGGPLNSQTVDDNGTVLYRVDSGRLGPLSNAEATGLVDRIFGL